MKRDCDTIQFESRRELAEIITELEKIIEKNPEKESIKNLHDELEYMYMYW